MFLKNVIVQNKLGLCARCATAFIRKANEYKSNIWLEKNDKKVNAKSLPEILSLEIERGANVSIIASGTDEDLAVEALVKLVTTSNLAKD